VSDKLCIICDKKATLSCVSCTQPVCKSCHEYVEPTTFSFWTKLPKGVVLGNYCPPCYEEKILPSQTLYDEIMEKAKDIYFLTKNYRGYVRVIRKHTKRVVIPSCADRRETILRMAFVAAELNFNAIIDAEVESAKVRDNKYQTTRWSGSSMPALIDGEQLERSSLRRI
jgi:hypothetical protein